MIFYETYVSLILDPPNAKGGCIIKEAENNISDKTEIVMNEVDAKKILYNQTDTVTQETQWNDIDLYSKVSWSTSSQNLSMENFYYK